MLKLSVDGAPPRPGGFGWWVLLAAVAVMAPWPTVSHLDHAAYALMTPWGRRWGWINAVWVLGSLPVTAAAVAWGGVRRGGWRAGARALAVLAVGVALEAILKAFLALPLPHPVAEPSWLALAEGWLNPRASAVWAWLGRHALVGAAKPPLRGSFPSGHTLRIALAVAACSRRRTVWAPTAAALGAGLAVTATGGHWLWDAVGGWCLACALCRWLPRGA